jgi:hypothetical protein
MMTHNWSLTSTASNSNVVGKENDDHRCAQLLFHAQLHYTIQCAQNTCLNEFDLGKLRGRSSSALHKHCCRALQPIEAALGVVVRSNQSLLTRESCDAISRDISALLESLRNLKELAEPVMQHCHNHIVPLVQQITKIAVDSNPVADDAPELDNQITAAAEADVDELALVDDDTERATPEVDVIDVAARVMTAKKETQPIKRNMDWDLDDDDDDDDDKNNNNNNNNDDNDTDDESSGVTIIAVIDRSKK